ERVGADRSDLLAGDELAPALGRHHLPEAAHIDETDPFAVVEVEERAREARRRGARLEPSDLARHAQVEAEPAAAREPHKNPLSLSLDVFDAPAAHAVAKNPLLYAGRFARARRRMHLVDRPAARPAKQVARVDLDLGQLGHRRTVAERLRGSMRACPLPEPVL